MAMSIETIGLNAEVTTGAYWGAHDLKPNIIIRTESVEAIRSLIAFRQGVTILSDMMYRPWSLEGSRIEVREVAANIPTMNTGFVLSRGREPGAEARAFIEFCRIEYDSGRLEVRRNMPIERE